MKKLKKRGISLLNKAESCFLQLSPACSREQRGRGERRFAGPQRCTKTKTRWRSFPLTRSADQDGFMVLLTCSARNIKTNLQLIDSLSLQREWRKQWRTRKLPTQPILCMAQSRWGLFGNLCTNVILDYFKRQTWQKSYFANFKVRKHFSVSAYSISLEWWTNHKEGAAEWGRTPTQTPS